MILALIEKDLHEKYLMTLNIFRFVRQEAFRRAYEIATPIEQAKVIELINNHDLALITVWTKQILRKHNEYAHLDVRYLRDLAQERNVYSYSTLTKLELISNLTKQTVEA